LSQRVQAAVLNPIPLDLSVRLVGITFSKRSFFHLPPLFAIYLEEAKNRGFSAHPFMSRSAFSFAPLNLVAVLIQQIKFFLVLVSSS